MPSLDSEGHKNVALPLAEASLPPSGPAQGSTSVAAQPESTMTSAHSSGMTTTTETAAPTIVRPDPNSGGSKSTDTAAHTTTVIQTPPTTDGRTTSTTVEQTIIQPTTDTDTFSNIYRPPTSSLDVATRARGWKLEPAVAEVDASIVAAVGMSQSAASASSVI